MLLSLALVILVGFLLAELAILLKLPRIVGMILTGIILGPYVLNWLDPTILLIGPDLRQLALVIILLRAGLSLDLADLKKVGTSAILLSFVPASFEIVGVTLASHFILHLSWIDAALLGSILAAVSPAIVVPRMLAMMKKRQGTAQSIPQMIMAGASVDDIYVILLFTSFLSAAQGSSLELMVIVDLVLSVFTGVLLGWVVGVLLTSLFKRYHYRDTTKVLILLSISLIFISVEQLLGNAIPFSGLIAVLALGITYLAFAPQVAERLVLKYEKIWVIAEMLLFVMVGAVVDITTLPLMGWNALAVILIGLAIRSIGTLVAVLPSTLSWKERLFVILAYLPKATVQASIGAIPLAMNLASGTTILTVAVLAILVTAPLGAWAIDLTAPILIKERQFLA